MTRNQPLHVLHVDDAQSFIDSVDYRVVTGDTLIFDFIYFLHPVGLHDDGISQLGAAGDMVQDGDTLLARDADLSTQRSRMTVAMVVMHRTTQILTVEQMHHQRSYSISRL